MPYTLVAEGDLRAYRIVCGLVPSYVDFTTVGSDELDARAGAATGLGLDWMAARADAGRPYLTGTFQDGFLATVWPVDPGRVVQRAEPALIFSGCLSPERDTGLINAEALDMLTELAETLGALLEQSRVQIEYCDMVQILQFADDVPARLAAVAGEVESP